MATVFERPMPALDDTQAPQILRQRRRRDSVEVIDVDELDDDIYQTHPAPEPGPSQPTQRRRISAASEIISLIESDDDDDDIVVTEPLIQPASRTRLQSPPPRNPPWRYMPQVPPVPPVPHRYAGQASLPLRRHAPSSSSPPIIRPNDQPFPFEAAMHQQHLHRQLAPILSVGPSSRPPRLHIPRVSDNREALPPRPLQPAPPSHHVPVMGLGGALIAQNHPRHQHQHQHRPYETGHSFLRRVGTGVHRMFGGPALAPGGGSRNGTNFYAIGNNFSFLDHPPDEEDDPDRMFALQLLAEDEREGFVDWDPARAFIRSEVLRRRTNAREQSPAYRKEYSHPHPPEPGFTFDFAPKSPVEVVHVTSPTIPTLRTPSPSKLIVIDDDDDSISTSKVTSTSHLSSQRSPSTSSSSKIQHQTPSKSISTAVLTCARCLDPLVLGSNLISKDQKERRVWGLRCGHLIDGKCLKELGQPCYTDQSTDLGFAVRDVLDRKGKGKAKVTDEDGDDNEYHDSFDNCEPPQINNIRSRLRPRHTGAATATTSSSNAASLLSFSSPSTHTTVKRGGRAKATAAQRRLPPPEFIWQCPVTGCGQQHVSIKVNGEWIPERDDSIYADPSSSAHGGRGRGRGAAGRGRNRATFGFDGLSAASNPGGCGGGPRGAIPLFL